jgi:hypothetical protein
VLFDQPGVIDGAREVLTRAGVVDRCTTEAGDFFERVPAGGDLYVLKSVLHNWDDADGVTILHSCRSAAHSHARLLIIERVIPEGNEPSEAKLFDINMLVMLRGLERTVDEYRALLRSGGFDLTRVIPTAAPISLLEAAPATAT